MTVTFSTGALVVLGLFGLGALLLGGSRGGCGCQMVVNLVLGLVCIGVGVWLLFISGILGG